mmetsp:Transcript_5101/g.13436  ORF Transcript_5101/g.13436 Transcript_5101/m.13436 type:complete len:353 (+) Transcript_5101:56-1114(+)
MQDGGAVQIKAKGEHWILYPCSSDEVPLEAEEYNKALEQWLKMLREYAKEARDAAEAGSHEQVLQQQWVELDEDDDWKAYWCTLTAKAGLSFYDEKEDAQSAPESPVCSLALDQIRGATRAPGIDFYDGVIDIEVYDSADLWRIRPTGHAAMHNLLSAINIYKVAPAAGSRPKGGQATSRGGIGQKTSRGGIMSRGGGQTARSGRAMSMIPGAGGLLSSRGDRKQSMFGGDRKQSMFGGDRKQSILGGGGLTSRMFGGRKESMVPQAGGNGLPLGGGLAGGLSSLKEGKLDEDDGYTGAASGPFAPPTSRKSGMLSRLSRANTQDLKAGQASARGGTPGRKFSLMPGFMSKR